MGATSSEVVGINMDLWLTMYDCSAIKKVTGDVVTCDKKQGLET